MGIRTSKWRKCLLIGLILTFTGCVPTHVKFQNIDQKAATTAPSKVPVKISLVSAVKSYGKGRVDLVSLTDQLFNVLKSSGSFETVEIDAVDYDYKIITDVVGVFDLFDNILHVDIQLVDRETNSRLFYRKYESGITFFQKDAIREISMHFQQSLGHFRLAAAKNEANPLQYSINRKPKAAEPVQHKPAIHVAYPKGGEQIADERVTLLGYVTSTNKTKSLKLFVNRKRQFVDELWRVSPIETIGLRGYPLDFLVPIETGKNIIEIRVLDQEGFMVNHVIEVNRIEIAETRVASSVSLGKRLPDLESKTQNKQVNENNFAVVIEDWVKQTAVSDYNKGNRMYDAGRLERAAYYYRKAVQTNPLTPAFFNLGLALKGIGNEHDARQAFVKACEQKEERACDMISQ